MATVTESRLAALEVLARSRRGELADRALVAVGDALESRERAWLRELVYGTLRLRGRIDFQLATFVRAGLDSLDATVLDILRLGAYQLAEMGSVPAYAAVSQSVELARMAGAGRAAGLVNGVLQAYGRGWRTVEFPSFEADAVGHLTHWGSHPAWLVKRWVERWGEEDARRLVDSNNRRPELYLTPFGHTALEAVDRLRQAGIEATTVESFPGSVRIAPSHGPGEALAAVTGVIQDPAAARVVDYADAAEGSLALDICAAPGGKSIGLARTAAFVVACDLSLGRLRRVRANVDRVGLGDRVALVAANGVNPPFRPMDHVLLDAPCTGTGTFRRHPDGRWRIGMHDLDSLVTLQRELLAAVATIVARGGVLVYSTCSLEPEENERQIEWFLASHPGFRRVAPKGLFDGTMLDGGYLRILPQHHMVDGAFSARLERVD